MKMDLRFAVGALALLALSACGQQRTASGVFEKASDECLGEVIPGRFTIRYFNGRVETISASSKDEFLARHVEPQLDQIEYAEHDFYVHAAAQARQSFTSFADNWGVARVQAEVLWQQGYRGAGVNVAVIDSGMDLGHPQLKKQVMTNPGEIGADRNGREKASNGIDDDGNGYVDDAFGYDFVANKGLTADYNVHGSHVAGIIAAAHTDTQAQGASYVQGIAPGAKILPLAFLNKQGSGAMSDGVRAIQYAVKRGVKVINASWGGTMCSRSLAETVDGLYSKGVIFVAAAGNSSSNVDRNKEYPASLDLAAQITVGAVGEYDYLAEYSNYGQRTVHIFAPGSNIVSTVPGGLQPLSGTSMATPLVAGAIAVLLSAEPNATVDQIRQALYTSSVKRSHYLNASQGRMDLAGTLQELRRLTTQ